MNRFITNDKRKTLIYLPDITLLCADCIDPVRANKVLKHCQKGITFGDVKLLTDADIPGATKIMPLRSLIAYSIFMLTEVHKYISTSHVLVVQRDGWILNPSAWRYSWLQYDYIAPLFIQYPQVGSGGFSLRSKRLMQRTAKNTPAWDGTEEHAQYIQRSLSYYEDGMISFSKKYKEFRIAPALEACEFGQGGNRDDAYLRECPFGFHRTWQSIDFATGQVDSSDLTRDLSVSYDHIIDEL